MMQAPPQTPVELKPDEKELMDSFTGFLKELLTVQPGEYNTNNRVEKIVGVAFSWVKGVSDPYKGGIVKVNIDRNGHQFTWKDAENWNDRPLISNWQSLMLSPEGRILYYNEASSDVKSVTQGPFWTPTGGNLQTLRLALSFVTWLSRKIVDGKLKPKEE